MQFNFLFDATKLLALGGSLKWTIRVQDISSFGSISYIKQAIHYF
jgi:hypothetical protein